MDFGLSSAAHVKPSSVMISFCVGVVKEPFSSVQRKGRGEKKAAVWGIAWQSKVEMGRFICPRQQTRSACFQDVSTMARQ